MVKNLIDAADERAEALDRLILREADQQLTGVDAGDIVVLEDSSEALTLQALARVLDESDTAPRVLVRYRSYQQAHAMRALAHRLLENRGQDAASRLVVAGLDTEALDLEGALAECSLKPTLALGRLPKALAALDDWSRALARHSAQTTTDVSLCLGGNTKHMTRTMNTVLEQSFSEVWAGRGQGKFRALLAKAPRQSVLAYTAEETQIPSGTLRGLGGVFSGGREDRGGSYLADIACDLLSTLDRPADGAALRVLDLGCGNGSVSLRLLHRAQELGIPLVLTATDLDADAVRSATQTLAPYRAGEQTATVTWDDAAAGSASGSFDLLLLNPPFHEGTRLDATMVRPLLDAATRLLAPGGRLLLVHNSHLRYRAQLEDRFEEVEQLGRNGTFTVLSACGAL